MFLGNLKASAWTTMISKYKAPPHSFLKRFIAISWGNLWWSCMIHFVLLHKIYETWLHVQKTVHLTDQLRSFILQENGCKSYYTKIKYYNISRPLFGYHKIRYKQNQYMKLNCCLKNQESKEGSKWVHVCSLHYKMSLVHPHKIP